MDHPLQGAVLRTKWAREHFDLLQRGIADWPADAHTVGITQNFDPNTNKITVSVESVPTYPAEWRRHASEMFFNLRVALDYLAWELAKWNLEFKGDTREPYARTQFPIASEESRLKKKKTGEVVDLQDLHPNHVAVILDLQPYNEVALDWILLQQRVDTENNLISHGLDPSKFNLPTFTISQTNTPGFRGVIAVWHPLMRISLMNDHDKHRTLRPMAVGSSYSEFGDGDGIDCDVVKTNYFMQLHYEVGAKLAEFDVVPTGPDPKVTMNNRITPQVSWGSQNPIGAFGEAYPFIRSLIRRFWIVFA